MVEGVRGAVRGDFGCEFGGRDIRACRGEDERLGGEVDGLERNTIRSVPGYRSSIMEAVVACLTNRMTVPPPPSL